MIKFFRHIRKNLLMENKTGKYFKYAIGEIVLVVIGILIALQINNWNENRKAQKKEQNLFSNLKIDFESRLTELKEFNNAKHESIKAILSLNSIIANKSNRPDDAVIDSLLSFTMLGFKFNEDFKMLDVVFNTGLINDITNQKLKRHLIEWPQKVEEMLEEQRMLNELIDNDWKSLLYQYISSRAVYEKFNFRNYNIPKGEPITLTKNYNGLLSNPFFENYLAEEEVIIRITIIDTKTLISSAEEIIALINNEL